MNCSVEIEVAIFAAEEAPAGMGTQSDVFLMHRDEQRLLSRARLAQWAGTWTWKRRAPGSIPGSTLFAIFITKILEKPLFLMKNKQKSLFWPRKKPLRGSGGRADIFLVHRDASEALLWSQNSPVGWASDSESGGTGFDSRLGRVILGSLFDHVGVTLGSFLGHLGNTLGTRW